jgi:hypothetical protein
MTRQAAKRQRGAFGLVEVLVSAFVLLAVISSSIMLFRSAQLSLKRAESGLSAVYLLQGQMEELRAIEFSALLPLNNTTFDGEKGRISVEKISDDLCLIDVSYQRDKVKKPMSLTTFRSKY